MRVLFWIGLVIGSLALGGFAVVAALDPPKLTVSEQVDLRLAGMTLIAPGIERIEGRTVAIVDGQIDSIDAENGRSDFECNGCFVLPGLSDMHVHFPPAFAVGQQRQFALMFLAHGVTAVRDAGSADQSTFAFRERIAAGNFVGPHLFTCGPIIDGSPSVFPTNVQVDGYEDGRQAVADLAERGADCIKIYNMLTVEAFAGVVSGAARYDLPLMGHVPHRVGMNGVAYFDVQHVTGMVEYEPSVIGFNDYNFVDIAQITNDRIDEVIQLARDNEISFTPTLINQVMRRTWEDEIRFPPEPAASELPRFWSSAWRGVFGGAFSLNTEQDHRDHLSRQLDIVRAFNQAGLTIYTGTDTMMPWTIPGAALHGELRELVRAGLTPEEALAASVNGPRHFFGDESLGRVAEGARADLVIFRDDPTQSLDALDTIEAVIVDGQLYTRDELDQMRATHQRHFRQGFYDAVMTPFIGSITGAFAPGGDEEE